MYISTVLLSNRSSSCRIKKIDLMSVSENNILPGTTDNWLMIKIYRFSKDWKVIRFSRDTRYINMTGSQSLSLKNHKVLSLSGIIMFNFGWLIFLDFVFLMRSDDEHILIVYTGQILKGQLSRNPCFIFKRLYQTAKV